METVYCLKFVPVKNSCFFENISQIYVRVQKVGIQGNGLLKMMYGQPDFTLRIEYTSQITPGNCKVRPCFDGLQVTSLHTRKCNMLLIEH